jgi:hypothetical protein
VRYRGEGDGLLYFATNVVLRDTHNGKMFINVGRKLSFGLDDRRLDLGRFSPISLQDQK